MSDREEVASDEGVAAAASVEATASAPGPDPTIDGAAKAEDKKEGEDNKDEAMFECNICLDVARDAVISLCGHLFCWPCLHQWLETRPNRKICPVCKAGISKEKVIPLYGRGNTDQVCWQCRGVFQLQEEILLYTPPTLL